MEITYDQGSEIIGHGFRKSLIEEYYGTSTNKSTSVNPSYNVILERIQTVMVNLIQTYNMKCANIDKDAPWSGILVAVAVGSICNSLHMKYIRIL